MTVLALSFTIESPSFLQVMRTAIESRMSSILAKIVQFAFDLPVLELRKRLLLTL